MTSKRYVVAVLSDDGGLEEVYAAPEPLTYKNGPEAVEVVKRLVPDHVSVVLVPLKLLSGLEVGQ